MRDVSAGRMLRAVEGRELIGCVSLLRALRGVEVLLYVWRLLRPDELGRLSRADIGRLSLENMVLLLDGSHVPRRNSCFCQLHVTDVTVVYADQC